MEFAIIAAITNDGGIGMNGTIPWKIKEDLIRFRILTTVAAEGRVNAVIMGRRTWQDIPGLVLPKRINFVVSSSLYNSEHRDKIEESTGVILVTSLDHAHAKLKEYHNIEKVFVIGGVALYKEALFNHRYTKAYITRIYENHVCDTFFPYKLLELRYKKIRLCNAGAMCAFIEYEQKYEDEDEACDVCEAGAAE